MKPPIRKQRCPRCRSKRVRRRLDGGKVCDCCGQRVARDGRLTPSADRRGEGGRDERQLFLL